MKKDIYKKLQTFSLARYIKKMHSGNQLRGIIFGNFGAMNLGDEAILAGELQELKKIKKVNVHVVSRNPKEIKRLHREKPIFLFNLVKIIKEIIVSDFVLIGGGGLICKADRGLIGFFYQLYMLLVFFLLPKLFRKNIYAVGLGVYKNTNPVVLQLANRLLRSVDLLTVRDHHSYELLKKMNISANLYKDNSFLMDLSPTSELMKDAFLKKHFRISEKNIGLALLKPDNEQDEKKIINFVLDAIKKYGKHTNVWLYPCDFQENFENDAAFAEKIRSAIINKFGKGMSCLIVPTSWSPQKFFSSFKLMDHFVAMRLHASIFAYRQSVPFTSIAYDLKCASFLDAIGKVPEMTIGIQPPKLQSTAVFNFEKKLKDAFFSLSTRVRRYIYLFLGTVDNIILSRKNTVTVLSYHSIMDDDWRFSIDPKEMKKQIAYLKSRYNFITLKDLEEYVSGTKQILTPSIVLTFDDGYKDIFELKQFFIKNNIKPALFVLSDPVNANEKEMGTKRTHLTKEDMMELQKIGWEIGSHTNTHPNLSELTATELNEEILDAKEALESELGNRIRYFAYPRGKYNEQVVKVVKKAGYSLALTMDDGFISAETNPLLIPRVGVDRTHSFSEFKALFSPLNVGFRRMIKASVVGRYI